MAIWNPWRGCRRFSEGCKFCYIHKGDARRGIDTEKIIKTDKFSLPTDTNKNGTPKIRPGQTVFTCFSSDFLIEEADEWRNECWNMMKARPDLSFLFLTKRIERFERCAPDDWGDGYDNVTIGCTVENQNAADIRLPIFQALPIKHKDIICQPLIDKIELSDYLFGIELVVVGGESDRNARPMDYSWVLDIRSKCEKHRVNFEFRQCGTNFIKDGVSYRLPVNRLASQAKKAGINLAF